MTSLKLFLTSRATIMLITVLATSIGTALATSYPSIYDAVCRGVV